MTISDFRRDRPKPKRQPAVEIPDAPRRSRKRRRRRTWPFAVAAMLLAIAAAPTVLCATPVGRAIARHYARGKSLDLSFASIRVGWLSPLHINAVELEGTAAGSRLRIEQLDSNVTLLRLLLGGRDTISVLARGVHLETEIFDGGSNLENDLAAIVSALESGTDRKSSGRSSDLVIEIEDLQVRCSDQVSEKTWSLSQGRADFRRIKDRYIGRLSAILSDPTGDSGSIDASLQIPHVAGSDGRFANDLETVIEARGVPLGFTALVRRRLAGFAAAVPQTIGGDASGTVTLTAAAGGEWAVSLSPLEVANLVMVDSPGTAAWQNASARMTGAIRITEHGLIGENLKIETDFADAEFDGIYIHASADKPLRWDTPADWAAAFDGKLSADIDLALLVERLPGLLPIRDGTTLTSGRIAGEVISDSRPDGSRSVRTSLRTDPLRARAGGRNLVIDPAGISATLRIAPDGAAYVDDCRLESVFASGTLHGDASQGKAEGRIDLSRLAAMLDPLIDIPELSLGGTAAGEISWSTQGNHRWQLQGDGNANDLTVYLPGGTRLHRPTLDIHADATGVWNGQSLQELTAAELSLRSPSLEVDAVLADSVASPTPQSEFPMRVSGRGRLEALVELISPWLPEGLHSLGGGFSGHFGGSFAAAAGRVTEAKLTLEEPRAGWRDQIYRQPSLSLDFAGMLTWPSVAVRADDLTVLSEALSIRSRKTPSPTGAVMALNWRADLGRLQNAVSPVSIELADHRGGPEVRGVSFPRAAQFADSTSPAWSDRWRLAGDAEGSLTVTRTPEAFEVTGTATGKDLKLFAVQGTSAAATSQPSWQEPNWKVDAACRYRRADGTLETHRLYVLTDWVAADLSGTVRGLDGPLDCRLDGPATLRMPEVARRLSELAGFPIRLEGIHETPLEIAIASRPDGTSNVRVAAGVGWEGGEIVGLVFGPAVMPLVASETALTIQPTAIPVDQGRLLVAGDVVYDDGPVRMILKPGPLAQNIRLTPDLTDRWLQYLAPMVSKATRVDGTVGVELTRGIIQLEAPQRSQVQGQLQISRVDFEAGPVTQDLLSNLRQIEMIVRARPGQDQLPASETRRLATLPTQSVDFAFADGTFTHQRLFMEIDRARVVTSGRVRMDGQLDLITQVPLEATWLGSDLRGLAGRTVTMPISGTLSRPRVDPSAVRDLVGQVGAQAIQATAESYLEKQLNRGLDRLRGK